MGIPTESEWKAYEESVMQYHNAAKDAKAKWEANNDRLKAIDAAYLGTTRLAFYGTYEESMQKRLGWNPSNVLAALAHYGSRSRLSGEAISKLRLELLLAVREHYSHISQCNQ